MTRQSKTPKQRAEDQLAVAERLAKRLKRRRDDLAAELAQVNEEYEKAGVRRSYLAKHPDLQPTTSTSPTSTASTGANA